MNEALCELFRSALRIFPQRNPSWGCLVNRIVMHNSAQISLSS